MSHSDTRLKGNKPDYRDISDICTLYISALWFVIGIFSSTSKTTFASEVEFQEEAAVIELTTSFTQKKKKK